MSEQQISILSLSILFTVWFVLDIVFFCLLNKELKEEYRKFYPHPLVGMIKDFKEDPKFRKHEVIFSSIILAVFWLPMTPVWFVFWLLCQLCNNCMEIYCDTQDTTVKSDTEESTKNEPSILKDIFDKLPISMDEETFLDLYTLVESELALEYFPVYFEETLDIDSTNKIKYYDFEYNPVRIIQVKSSDGSELKFRLFPKSLKILDKDVVDKVIVRYTYLPTRVTTLEKSGAYKISEYFNVLMFGILSEYYMREGNFEIAADYVKLYKNEIQTIYDNKGVEHENQDVE